MKILTDEDAAEWSRPLSNPVLSPDGRWFAYLWKPFGRPLGNEVTDARPQMVLRNVATDEARVYFAAHTLSNVGDLQMSESGEWITWVDSPGDGDAPSQVPVIVLIRVATGAETRFPDQTHATFVGKNHDYLLLQERSKRGSSTFTVRVTALFAPELRGTASSRDFLRNDVIAYGLPANKTRLAWVDKDGVHIVDFSTGQIHDVVAGIDRSYSDLVWSDSGDRLAVLSRKGDSIDLIVATDIGTSKITKKALTVSGIAGVPAGYSISEVTNPAATVHSKRANVLVWRRDESGLFFSVQPAGSLSGHERPSSTSPSSNPIAPGVVLWHWKDEQLPTQKLQSSGRDHNMILGFLCLKRERFVPLADGELDSIDLVSPGRYVLAFNWRAYGWQNYVRETARSYQLRDYYLIDLDSGQRRVLKKGLNVAAVGGLALVPTFSPDGRVVLYQDNQGDYVVQDIVTATERNVTQGLPTQFHFSANSPQHGFLPRTRDDDAQGVLQGWTNNGRFALVSDYYDVWALPLGSGQPINLTGNGRRERVVYQLETFEPAPYADVRELAYNYMPRERGVSLDDEIFFSFVDLRTGATGIARRNPSERSVEILQSEDASTTYFRTPDAATRIYSRQTASEGLAYATLYSDWKPKKLLTDFYPQQKYFQWIPGSKHLSFVTSNSDHSQAVLFPPVGARAGMSYPTVVMIYEKWHGALHAYREPNDFVFSWLRSGYAVLLPDMQLRMDHPGEAALEAVTAAVKAATATGTVNEKRLGLVGHSFGGYETFYITTHTDMFRAAIPIEGITDLISCYGAVYADGTPWSPLVQKGQPYLTRSWWEDWDLYIRNSPLFSAMNLRTPLLIIHGDEDKSVPFSQSMAMFNTLRKLGDRPVVLLQYVGKGHGDVNFLFDTATRERQFFDHFLKGQPAPDWWENGVSSPRAEK